MHPCHMLRLFVSERMSLTKNKILAQVALIRESSNVFLIDTAQHFRRLGDIISHGTAVINFAAPTTILCRLIIRSGSVSDNIAAQARLVEQQKYTGLFRMQVPYELDIHIGDRINYTDRLTGQNRLLDVIFVPAHNQYTGAMVVSLQEVI